MTTEGATREVATALRRLGSAPRTVELVTPSGTGKAGRPAFRVETLDGRTVKVRVLDSSEEARALVELRADLECAFAPVIGRNGRVLVEEWSDGTPLEVSETPSRLEEAGALLGRLHERALPTGHPRVQTTADRRRQACEDLAALVGAGQLATAEADALTAALKRLDPGITPAAVVHQDFCAENMLLDREGRLRVVDNEWVAVGCAGFDLGRTHDRWGLVATDWARFLDGYRSAGREPSDTVFWIVIAALWGARLRYERNPARLTASLVRLRQLAASLATTTVA